MYIYSVVYGVTVAGKGIYIYIYIYVGTDK